MIIVTPLLTLVTQSAQINSEINVSYVVALHIWMMSCIFFVFMALVEYIGAIIYVHSLEDKKEVNYIDLRNLMRFQDFLETKN